MMGHFGRPQHGAEIVLRKIPERLTILLLGGELNIAKNKGAEIDKFTRGTISG